MFVLLKIVCYEANHLFYILTLPVGLYVCF